MLAKNRFNLFNQLTKLTNQLYTLNMKLTTTIIINKPIKEVWDFYDDPDNLKLWLRGFQTFEHVSGERGQIGAKSRHTYLENGKTIIMDEEITARIPYKEFSGILTHDIMSTTLTNTFEDLGNGSTRLVCIVDTKFKPFFLRLLSPLMKGMFRRRQEKDFGKLKECLEGN